MYDSLLCVENQKSLQRSMCPDALSLVTAVYITPWPEILLFQMEGGGCPTLAFVDMDTCSLVEMIGDVEFGADRLTLHSYCTAYHDDNDGSLSCVGARVYAMDKGRLTFLSEASGELTKQELGVAFTGYRRLLEPRTPAVQDLGPVNGLY